MVTITDLLKDYRKNKARLRALTPPGDDHLARCVRIAEEAFADPGLTEIEGRLLWLRYGRGKSWTAISMESYYSERQARRIVKKAVRKLEKEWCI